MPVVKEEEDRRLTCEKSATWCFVVPLAHFIGRRHAKIIGLVSFFIGGPPLSYAFTWHLLMCDDGIRAKVIFHPRSLPLLFVCLALEAPMFHFLGLLYAFRMFSVFTGTIKSN